MMYLISDAHRGGECAGDLDDIFRLRHRVFKQRLGWDVRCENGRERDQYDSYHPVYLAYKGATGKLEGCVRLLPTTGPNMLRDTFSELLDGEAAPVSPRVWESSRFSLDGDPAKKGPVGLAQATHELFAGMIEFGLAWNLTHIVTVTDIRVERILKRAGWSLQRIGKVIRFGDTKTVAGYLKTDHEALHAVRRIGGISGPVLWMPAPIAAA